MKIRYIVKTVAPDVPSGAFLPSTRSPLSDKRFITRGGNVGCTLSSVAVRCTIVNRVWTPPAQPSSCTAAWGNALVLARTGYATFACGGVSTPAQDAPVIPDGYDDTAYGFTCQIRVFAVDCFRSTDGRGLLISHTGYTTY